MFTKSVRLLTLAAALSFALSSARAITLGQVDTFQDGTRMNWLNGASAVELINTGGPAGAGDAYIQVTADGGGSGGRLVAQNYTFPPSFNSQWTGNYLAAGVNAISFDLLNQSSVTLSIRIAFKTEVTQSSPGYLSSRVILAPGTGWQRFTISIAPGALTAIGGPAPYNTFFQNGFAEIRIIHEVGSSNLNGDPVNARLGIDNIRAVPEPTVTGLALLGLGGLGVRAWRRGRRSRS